MTPAAISSLGAVERRRRPPARARARRGSRRRDPMPSSGTLAAAASSSATASAARPAWRSARPKHTRRSKLNCEVTSESRCEVERDGQRVGGPRGHEDLEARRVRRSESSWSPSWSSSPIWRSTASNGLARPGRPPASARIWIADGLAGAPRIAELAHRVDGRARTLHRGAGPTRPQRDVAEQHLQDRGDPAVADGLALRAAARARAARPRRAGPA